MKLVSFTEKEIQDMINALGEAPAKYTTGVIIKLSDRVRRPLVVPPALEKKEEEKQPKEDEKTDN